MSARVLHVVAGLEAGGLAESVPALALAQAGLGAEVSLATVGDPARLSPAAHAAAAGGVRLACFPRLGPASLFFSPALFRALPEWTREADVVHVHSMWTFPVACACHFARAHGKVLVLSPRGCLDPVRLEHSAWKKWLAGWAFDRHNLRSAHLLHATSRFERGWIEDYFARTTTLRGRNPVSRIAVIPNGVAEPPEPLAPLPCRDAGPRTVLSLGRLHPLKGLDLLVEAWGMLPPHPGWRLAICGPDEQGTLASLRAAVARLGTRGAGPVEFLPPVEGEGKWRLLRSADLFVLPSRSENFGTVAGEALACGLPVVCTRAAPWGELEPGGPRPRSGWWVDVSAAAIAAALREAMDLPGDARAALGEAGRRLVAERYRWPALAARMLAAYGSATVPGQG